MNSCPCPEDGFLHREVVANGLRFHVVESGRGPLVLLLHGFPDYWYAWRHQLPALAAAGFRKSRSRGFPTRATGCRPTRRTA